MPRGSAVALLACLACALGACGGKPPAAGLVHPAEQKTFGGDRPVTIQVPAQYDNSKPTPLIIVLHGYSVDGVLEEAYLGFDSLVDEAGVIVAAPDGTVNENGLRFWNATDACCNFFGSTVDDVGYITSLITAISVEWNVDARRVYLMGHSNGGFMAYRMACEKAPLLAGIVSLAGDTYADPSKCAPSEDVSVLQIQGDQDEDIAYGGGTINGVAYPGSVESVHIWSGYDHCSDDLVSAGANLDLDPTLAGAETEIQHESSCPTGIDIGLWTIHGGSHIPDVGPSFRADVWAWMNSHPKP